MHSILSCILNGTKKKKKIMYIKYTKFGVVFLKLLLSEGLIFSFYKEFESIRVILKTQTNVCTNSIQIKGFSMISRFVFISYKDLIVLVYLNPTCIFILSTKIGLVTQKEALHCRAGGKLYCKIQI